MAGVALGDMDVYFAWQAWHWAGSQLTPLSPRLFAWQAWHLATWPSLCVASVALGDIDLHFAWQAWHLVTWIVTLRGRRGTYGTGLAPVARLFPVVAVVAVVVAAVGVAGVALDDIDLQFVWQAWHLATSTFTLRGRRGLGDMDRSKRGTYGTGLALVLGSQLTPLSPWLLAWQAWHLVTWTFTLRGRRGTW